MEFSIREARPSDWSGVAAVLAELGRPDVRGVPDEELHRQHFIAYLEREDADAFTAHADDKVIGFVNVEYRARLNYAAPQGWIAELIVAEGARGAGVGKALLSRAEAEARERRCWGIALESANWRNDAHRFYQREGWEQAALAFTKIYS